MAKTAYHGLPLSLEDSAWALTGKDLKDKKGQGLMLRWSQAAWVSKPTVRRLLGGLKIRRARINLIEVTEYCKRDVEAARILDRSLFDLPDREKEIWLMDLEINSRGVLLDDKLALRLEKLSKEKQEQVAHDLRKKWGATSKLNITSSLSIGHSGKLREWLVTNENLTLPDVTQGTIAAALRRPGPVRALPGCA